ncbi:hypothetical protein Trydic_g4938 [Trypoxylus dichotomus]
MVILLFLISTKIRWGKAECGRNKSVRAQVNYLYSTSSKNLMGGVLENDPDVLQVTYETCLYCLNSGTLSNLENIQKVFLENVCIRRIWPEFFLHTPKLETISLKLNQIKEVPRRVFDYSQVKIIDLSHNKIDAIEKYAFADMSMVSLNLAHNFLRYIDDTWFENSFIEELSLANNNILRLQNHVFAMVRQLDKLNLIFNNIHVIEDDLGVGVVNSLVLAGNVLTNLKFLKNIRSHFLDISFNRISYLDSNDILWVDELVMEPNPWHCSCLQKFWKNKELQTLTTQSVVAKHGWNEMFPVCTVSKKQQYDCQYKLDEDILEAQDHYFKLVDYAKMQINA